MSEHTPGRLELDKRLLKIGALWIAEMSGTMENPGVAADAEHLIACWNACEGINPEAVPELLKALRAFLAWEGAVNWTPARFGIPLRAAIAKAEKGKK